MSIDLCLRYERQTVRLQWLPICSYAPGMNDGRRLIELEATAGLNIWNMKGIYLGNDAGLELRRGRAGILAALPGDICQGSHLSLH